MRQLSLFVASALLFAFPAARPPVMREAVTLESLASALDGSMDTLLDSADATAAAGLASDVSGLAAALTSLNAASDQQTQILADASSPNGLAVLGKNAKPLQAKLGATKKSIAKASQLLAKAQAVGSLTPSGAKKLLGGIRDSLKAALGGVSAFQKTGASAVILVEKNAASAGFHDPGDIVTFQILSNPFATACGDVAHVTITNVGGPDVVVSSVLELDVPIGQTFGVLMGPDKGAATVTVTACGSESRRLLFNRGGLSQTLQAGSFNGSYSGSYKGSVKVLFHSTDPPQLFTVEGLVEGTVAGGTFTVLEPGSGSGFAYASGKIASGGGAGVEDGWPSPVHYSFLGKAKLVGGKATVSGTWVAESHDADFDSYAKGTWKAARP